MSLLIRLVLAVAVVTGVLGMALVVSGSASAASAQQTCSLSRAVVEDTSFLFHSTLLRVRLQASWCWDGKAVTRMKASCEIEKIDRVTISVDRCQPQTSPLSWRGNPNGAAYAQVSVNYSNCIFRYGCWQSAVLNIERWFYADGIIAKNPRHGQGADNV